PDQARDAQVLSLDAHRRNRPGDAPADGPNPDEVALDPRGTHPSGRGRDTAADAGTAEDDDAATSVDGPSEDSAAPQTDGVAEQKDSDTAPAEKTPAPRRPK